MNDDDEFEAFFDSDEIRKAIKALEDFNAQWDNHPEYSMTYRNIGEMNTREFTASVCSDLDEDCKDVKCKTTCWAHDPGRGYCPLMYGIDVEKIK